MGIDDNPTQSNHNWMFAQIKADYLTVEWPDSSGQEHWNLGTLNNEKFLRAFTPALDQHKEKWSKDIPPNIDQLMEDVSAAIKQAATETV